jgi:putative addiction module component (TIGR02574 family)
MTRIELQQAVLTLPSSERLELVHALWESLPPQDVPSISAEELALIDEGIREYEANPGDVVSWEVVEAELWPKG